MFVQAIFTYHIYFNIIFKGFHVFADITDGFGGLASSVLTEIADDYSAKSILTFGVTAAKDNYELSDSVSDGMSLAPFLY